MPANSKSPIWRFTGFRESKLSNALAPLRRLNGAVMFAGMAPSHKDVYSVMERNLDSGFVSTSHASIFATTCG